MSTTEPPTAAAQGHRAPSGAPITERGPAPPPGVEIRTLSAADEMVEAVELFKRIWGSPTELVRLEMMMAIGHSGGYVSAAFDAASRGRGGTMVGASIGILARHHDAPALHSHITGLLPDRRGSGLGRTLKLHQAAWAAARGIDWIVWTFDPLVRRNAWFNIAVLGAEVDGYLPRFYGEMTDAINAGDDSDRLHVAWYVPEAGTGPVRDGSDVDGADLVPTPDDVVELRRDDPAAVARWRVETRRSLTAALAAGRRVAGFTRDGEYVIGPR